MRASRHGTPSALRVNGADDVALVIASILYSASISPRVFDVRLARLRLLRANAIIIPVVPDRQAGRMGDGHTV